MADLFITGLLGEMDSHKETKVLAGGVGRRPSSAAVALRLEANTLIFLHVCMPGHFSHVQLIATVAHQAPLSMEFSRQEYWSGLPYPPLRDLPDPGIKPTSLMSPALQVGSLPLMSPGKHLILSKHYKV